jgi:hypothetical protein
LENQRPRNWPKSFIKASGPAHRSFAVHSGENSENTAKIQYKPQCILSLEHRGKKIMFSAHRSFTVLSGEMNGITAKNRNKIIKIQKRPIE